jgi:hypothetical protein
VYELGDAAGRLFAGAFVKRAKFNVRVQPTDRGISVSVISGMSGVSGGAIGVVREGKQRKHLAADLHAYFGAAPVTAVSAPVTAAQATTAAAPALPADPGLPTRPCPHCSRPVPCTAQQCSACGGLSPAWLLHEGRWWTRDAAGTLYWHDPATNAWIRYAEHTA